MYGASIPFLVGILDISLGSAIFQGKNWARIFVLIFSIIFSILSFLILIEELAKGPSSPTLGSALSLSLGFDIFVIWVLLFNNEAKEYFKQIKLQEKSKKNNSQINEASTQKN